MNFEVAMELINANLKKMIRNIRKHSELKFPDNEIIRMTIKDLIQEVRGLEEMRDRFTPSEQYTIGKTVGRLEAIYSIIYPEGEKGVK
jgi:hypothetical protein